MAGAVIAHTLQDAIAKCGADAEAFLIGGAELYAEGFKLADKLYLTEVHAEYAGDAFMPEFDLKQWQEISREAHTSENGLRFSYVTYTRR